MKKGTVVSSHPLAARSGIEILQRGGNAVDAAIATAFALTVVEPYNCGLGGAGGFMSIFTNSEVHTIDYNMVAPKLARADMYTLVEMTEDDQQKGMVSPHRFSKEVKDAANNVGYRSIGVPGTVAGLCEAQRKFGKLTLETVMQPALRYAENGFEVTWYDSLMMAVHLEFLSMFGSTSELYLNKGRPYKPATLYPTSPADRIVQRDLARVLHAIARHGADAFYRGWVANAIVSQIEENGGMITAGDLAEYEPRWLKSGVCSYKNLEIFYVPANSGGTTVIEALNILEGLNISRLPHNSARFLHFVAEALAIAFTDRFQYLGDPEFERTPVGKLVSKDYAKRQAKKILEGRAPDLRSKPDRYLSNDTTTHLCTLDSEGSMVSLTQTLGSMFGSGASIRGTGILMNNDMHWFDPEPNRPNSIVPGKKPLANMSPIIGISKTSQMALGSSGGRRLVSALVQVILNIIDYKMLLKKAIDAPRIHRETEEIIVDARISNSVKGLLEEAGHRSIPVERTPTGHDFGYPCGIRKDKDGTISAGIGYERQGVCLSV